MKIGYMDDPSSFCVLEWLILFILNTEFNGDVNRWRVSVMDTSVSLSIDDRDSKFTGKILSGKFYK